MHIAEIFEKDIVLLTPEKFGAIYFAVWTYHGVFLKNLNTYLSEIEKEFENTVAYTVADSLEEQIYRYGIKLKE